MKCILIIILALCFLGCTSQKSINYSQIDNIEDIDESVIIDFYKNVLDTLIGDNYLLSKPHMKTRLIDSDFGLSGLTDLDQDFFKEQISKFETLQWEDLLEGNRIVSQDQTDSIFSIGARAGWEIFREQYGNYCLCYLSTPLFSKDCRRVYIDYGYQCAPLWGEGQILVYELVDNKWTLKERYGIWVS